MRSPGMVRSGSYGDGRQRPTGLYGTCMDLGRHQPFLHCYARHPLVILAPPRWPPFMPSSDAYISRISSDSIAIVGRGCHGVALTTICPPCGRSRQAAHCLGLAVHRGLAMRGYQRSGHIAYPIRRYRVACREPGSEGAHRPRTATGQSLVTSGGEPPLAKRQYVEAHRRQDERQDLGWQWPGPF